MLTDDFGRRFTYLRLSLTDVCNFRCIYCLPNGYQGCKVSRQSFLTPKEIKCLMSTMIEMGVKKVRLTGGEPTLRRDFFPILEILSSYPSLTTIALTTNAYSLYKHAKDYNKAGLTHITISLDSLTPSVFEKMTNMSNFNTVLKGVEQCIEARYEKVKLNAVLLKDINDTPKEITQFFQYVKNNPVTVRFIELMKTEDNLSLFEKQFSSTNKIVEKLQEEGWQLQQKTITDGPAREFYHPDYMGRIGIISPYSSIFCESCNRLRISAKGELYVCLFHKTFTPLRDLLQDPNQQSILINRIREAYTQKKVSHFLHDGEIGRKKHFSSIGG